MKFNPPCYSVTFELLEWLTDSSVEKACLCAECICAFACLKDRVCLCVCMHVCLNFYSSDSQSELKEQGHFSQYEVIFVQSVLYQGAILWSGT